MTKIFTSSKIFLRITKLWSALSIAFLMYMIIGHLFGSELQNLASPKDFISLTLFPLGVLVGQLWAWKTAKVGGLIATLSFALFYIIHPETIMAPWFAVNAVPGLLFLIYGFLIQKSQ